MPTAHLPYVQHHGVDRHPGSVLTMAITENGTILASGGSQGTRLWNVADMLQMRCPSGAGRRGATLVIIWARQANEAHNVLYGGTQNGYFFCWHQKDGVFEETFVLQLPEPSEITAMAFDATNNRLCLCSRNDMVQSWAISKDPVTGKWTPINIFSRKFSRLSPQAITFAAFDNSQDRDVIVLGFHNSGPVYMIHGKTRETASAWSVGAKISLTIATSVETRRSIGGTVSFALKTPILVPPSSGSDQIKSKGFEIDRSRKDARPRKVRFGEEGATLVCGSDHGCVYVLDTRSGTELAKLSVGSMEWVQVVSFVQTTEVDNVSVIFAAQMRALDSSEEIFVWKRAQPPRNTGTTSEKLVWLAKALVLLGALAFVYQNVAGPMRKVVETYGGAQVRTSNLKGSVSGDFKGGVGKDSKDFVVVDVRMQR
ncbi:WD40-repeat-containing domain protein [Mycena rosella]|uniref:WD40-repeat-containing domain protein n=1 Tax=Mycena rosella TaxID=1033263 RepID=A0AAD7FKU4_MYCRO|nr:WD40-repeat-containing domain protein [Mycena rosella]